MLCAMQVAFANTFLPVIGFPNSLVNTFIVIFLIAIGMSLYQKVLSFLAVKEVFATTFIVVSLLTVATIFAVAQTSFGMEIIPFTVNSQTLEFVTIQETVLNEWISVGLLSVLTGLVSAIINSLIRIE